MTILERISTAWHVLITGTLPVVEQEEVEREPPEPWFRQQAMARHDRLREQREREAELPATLYHARNIARLDAATQARFK